MRPPKILIYNFTLRRDTAGAILLKNLLERRGAQTLLSCGRNFEHYLRFWRPDIVLINSISKLGRVRELLPHTKVVLWPGEGGEPDKSSNARMLAERGQDFSQIDLVLSWGEHDRSLFRKYFPRDTQKVVVCGNPKLDLIKFNADLHALKSKAETIGFIGRFNSLNHYDGRPTIYSLNKSDNLGSVVTQAKGYVTMVRVIDHLINHTDYKISFRPHPLEAPENYKYLKELYGSRLSIDQNFDLAFWIAQQRCILTPSSTSFLEAYLTHTPIINIENLQGGPQDKNQVFAALSRKVGVVPDSFEELIAILDNLPAAAQLTELEEHLRDVHGYEMQGSACARAAETLVPVKIDKKIPDIVGFSFQIIDWYLYRKASKKNRLHGNFNYHPWVHRTPSYYKKILEAIENELS